MKSAALGGLFAFFAFWSTAHFLLDAIYRMNYTTPFYLFIIPVLGFTAGVALRKLAHRNPTPLVQASALIGGVIMLWAIAIKTWRDFRYAYSVDNPTTVIATEVVIGVFIIVVVARLGSPPSSESDGPAGHVLLLQSLPIVGRFFEGDSRVREEGPGSGPPQQELPADADSETESRRRPSRNLRYWLVVGGAFGVCLPLALVNTELGIGLLSTFISAYAMSPRFDRRATDANQE